MGQKQRNSGVLKIFSQPNNNNNNNNINNTELADASSSGSERVGEDPGVHSDEPWGQDVLQQRIKYFNKVISATGASIDKAAVEEATARMLNPFEKEEALGWQLYLFKTALYYPFQMDHLKVYALSLCKDLHM